MCTLPPHCNPSFLLLSPLPLLGLDLGLLLLLHPSVKLTGQITRWAHHVPLPLLVHLLLFGLCVYMYDITEGHC